MVRSHLKVTQRKTGRTNRTIVLGTVGCLVGVALIACRSKPYQPSPFMGVNLQQQQQQQSQPSLLAIPPVRCSQIIASEYNDPNHGQNYTRKMDGTRHPFWMSFHSKAFDPIRWSAYENGQYYETEQERYWVYILERARPDSRILDVGGNIGYYSLVSASVQPTFVVDAFEPNELNILRFCESLRYNEWRNEWETSNNRARVNLYQYGMSDKPGRLQFFPDSNPGAGTFRKPKSGTRDARYLDISTLDQFAQERNWFESPPVVPILKVDVEGLEANVLLGGKRLLQAKIVQNIFMEMASDPSTKELQKSGLQLLLDCGYTLKAYGGVEGPSIACSWAHDSTLVDTIYQYIDKQMKQKSLHVNLFWTLRNE